MRTIRTVANICVVGLGVVTALAPMAAQRAAQDASRQAPSPQYRAPIVASTRLRMHPDSDEIVGDIVMKTLADGMHVVSMTMPPRRQLRPGDVIATSSLFLVVDSQDGAH